ncbi:MAG: D-glycero-beta-D-manno-heptose-7-phosphate kinase [Candidatus Omnitrophica bacterium]|nr:D-glycero-beta-D-manno-heptose-7-phosphate kinase [Candidatus Omnitrophota bacterium]
MLYKDIIKRFKSKTIMVIGDVILDRYIKGSVSRISPEAPVPVLLEEEFSYTPGGASNVAHNLRRLGANVIQVGRIGNDFEGQLLKRELKRKDINISGIFLDNKAPTITKTRVIANHQQIVRIDKERIGTENKLVQEKILQFIEKHIDECDGIILSDYGKGVITSELVEFVCNLALRKKKIITVDPKVGHFSFYRKVTCITPNLKEAENAIRNIKITSNVPTLDITVDRLHTDKEIDKAGQELMRYLDLQSLLITLGERGMRLFEKNKKPFSIPTQAQEVFDVTGAGDAVISVFTLSLTAGADRRQAAKMANAAAGVVVGKLGVYAVSVEELIGAIKK